MISDSCIVSIIPPPFIEADRKRSAMVKSEMLGDCKDTKEANGAEI